MRRAHLTPDHDLFRESVETFVEREMAPHHEEWDEAGIVPHELFATAGAAGFLGDGGARGVRRRRRRRLPLQPGGRRGAADAGVGAAGLGLTLHNDICLPYFLSLTTDEQQARWLPGTCAAASSSPRSAMTEPGIGSDLASMSTTRDPRRRPLRRERREDLHHQRHQRRPRDHRGEDRPGASGTAGMSLLVIERGMDGFERGRNLEKIGLHAQDTAELFFTDVHVPVDNLLGVEGQGFAHLVDNLPQERLSIAVRGVAAAEAALRWTLEYAKQRAGVRLAGRVVPEHPLRARRDAHRDRHRAGVRRPLRDALNAGELTVEEAAEAKWWCTELQKRTVDRCLQLHGGYGYMLEYPIARAYLDARVTTIYGGTTEIMKEIIGRSMVAKDEA